MRGGAALIIGQTDNQSTLPIRVYDEAVDMIEAEARGCAKEPWDEGITCLIDLRHPWSAGHPDAEANAKWFCNQNSLKETYGTNHHPKLRPLFRAS